MDAIFSAVKENIKLSTLKLLDNQLGDKGIRPIGKHLCSNKRGNFALNLRHLDLSDNLLTGCGINCIFDWLKNVNGILTLILDSNPMTDEEELSSFGEYCQENAFIKNLSLRSCNIDFKKSLKVADGI